MLPIFLLATFLLLLAHFGPPPAQVDCLNLNALKKTKEEVENELPKQVVYDEQGFLTIHGSFPGTSEPIAVDRKPLLSRCSNRPYYKFTVCPEKKLAFLKNHTVCSQGIIFCYEGQLNADKVREQFVLPKLQSEITKKCKEFNGFKLAMHFIRGGLERKAKLFLEVATSFTAQSYFFPMPDSQCLDLSLGNADNILAGVRAVENDNKLVRPVEVVLNKSWTGFHYDGDDVEKEKKFMEDFTKLPNAKKKERYRDGAHLKMLYMDFRAGLFTPQMMLAIVPDGECNMMVRVRGNLIQTCKAEFKQKKFALQALNDSRAETSYALTIESGTDDWKTSGRRSGKSKANSESTENAGSTTDESTNTQGLQRESEHVSKSSDTNTETKGEESGTSVGGSAYAQGTATVGKGGFDAEATGRLDGSINHETSDGFSDMTEKFSSRESRESHSETTITSKTSILETAFRRTQTSINTQKKQTFSSQTVGIQKRTMFKWIVKVPPGKVMTPMQMSVDCDGASVKIPQIKFVVTEAGDEKPVPDYEGGGN